MSFKAPAPVALALLALACGRQAPQAKPDVERLAIVAFDNQSSDATANWVGYSTASLTAAELAGALDLFAYPASSMAQAWEQRPTQSLQGYLTRQQGAWRLVAHRRDIATGQTAQSYTVKGIHPGQLADHLVEAMGRKPAFRSGSFPPESLELHGRWLLEPVVPGAAARLRRVFELAPGFTEAARVYALITSNDRAQSIATARAALDKAEAPVPRARIEHALAQLSGDAAGRRKAAEVLSALVPSDAVIAEEAANDVLRARDYIAGARLYQRALRADPHSADLNNNAAFAFVLVGDLPSARAAIARYQTLAPTSGNPLDSLGEVLCIAGRFDESAAAFLDSHAKEPALLNGVTVRKAAFVRRLAGQQPEADKLFARYAEQQKANPALPLEQAQWDYIGGRKAEAIANLEAFVAKSSLSLAASQLAVWRLAAGDPAVAARHAQQAWKSAVSPIDRQSAVLALFAAQPDADAAIWAQRAEQQLAGPAGAALRNSAIAYALLIRRQYAAAVPFLRAVNGAAHPARATEAQALFAIALMESGMAAEAKPLLRTWPVPRSFGDGTFEFLIYPAIRKWMAAS